MAKEEKKAEDVQIVKLETLVEDYGRVASLAKVKLPVKIAYWIGRITNQVISEIKQYEKTKDDLIKKHGKKKRDGNYQVEEKNLEKYRKELEELLQIEVELKFRKINIDDLGYEAEIEGQQLLPWIFDFEASTIR